MMTNICRNTTKTHVQIPNKRGFSLVYAVPNNNKIEFRILYSEAHDQCKHYAMCMNPRFFTFHK